MQVQEALAFKLHSLYCPMCKRRFSNSREWVLGQNGKGPLMKVLTMTFMIVRISLWADNEYISENLTLQAEDRKHPHIKQRGPEPNLDYPHAYHKDLILNRQENIEERKRATLNFSDRATISTSKEKLRVTSQRDKWTNTKKTTGKQSLPRFF